MCKRFGAILVFFLASLNIDEKQIKIALYIR